MSIRFVNVASTVLSCTLFSSLALGQAYPTKPIRVMTGGAGGALDAALRIIGQGISGPLGQDIVVDNQLSINLPQDRIAKGTPDGYTLGYLANNVWLAPLFRADMTYDPVKDFSPICLTAVIPNVLVVNSQLPVNSVAELVAMAKAKPGDLNAYIAGGGSPSLAQFLFQSESGTKFTTVRYKSVSQGLTDVVAGTLHFMFPTVASALPVAKSGKVRILAVTTRERSALVPNLPTVASFGFPGFESLSTHALLAPPKTPPAIVNRLNYEIVRFLSQSDTKARLGTMGIEVVASSPDYLGNFMRTELDKMRSVFNAAGIKPGDLQE